MVMRSGVVPPLDTHDRLLQGQRYALLVKRLWIWCINQSELHTFNLGGAMGAHSLVVQQFHFLFLGG